jgi:hypothetical protein
MPKKLKKMLEEHAQEMGAPLDEERTFLVRFGYTPDHRYVVLRDHTTRVLADQVSTLIGFGWTPQGGVSVASVDGKPLFTQALMKDSDE